MKVLKLVGHLLVILLLTIATQVGGIIWLISIFLSKRVTWKKRFIFPILYLVFNLLIIPPVAKVFGREQLPITSNDVKPINWFYPMTFRNYAKPELKELLIETSKKSNTTITYLDANFPFINGFPLLPHLSHDDGKKIDISFMYKTENGKSTNKKPSFSGYGAYVNSDKNFTTSSCKSKGYWQYDFSKYLTFGSSDDLDFDAKKTKALIRELLNHSETQKLFVEPHLKSSLGLSNYSKIRFHGCQAVRHDDHIHLQIR
ncbi:MAG: hypothetical protein EVB11_07775 [Winogradskyella sp.]|nr:MAG: hypothetical protein EVB11_07775 [Winogradskyella sp.]